MRKFNRTLIFIADRGKFTCTVLAAVLEAAVASSAIAAENKLDLYELTLEELIQVVTATRRETSLQTAAMSITAFDGAEFEKNGYNNIGQFIDAVPGVMALAGSPGKTTIIIRNISTSNQETGSATTATYFDDFPTGRLGSGIRLVDLDRVEVLKGPQGTLFGRSAMSGIVRYISNKPNTETVSGGVNFYTSKTTDGGSNVGGHGYLNLPITDDLAVRFVGYDYQNSGFIDNVELGQEDYNEEDTVGGRVAVRWDVSDTFSLDLTYLQQEVDGAPNTVTTTYDPGDLAVSSDEGPVIPFDVEARTNIAGRTEEDNREQDVVNLKLENDFDSFTATLLATKAGSKSEIIYDGRAWFPFFPLTFGNLETTGNNEQDTELLEFRLVSNFDNAIDWITGVYYENTKTQIDGTVHYFGPDFVFPVVDGTKLLDGITQEYNKEKAVYGELGFNLSAKDKLIIGYRRSDIEFGTKLTQGAGPFDDNTLLGQAFVTQQDVDTYKLSFEHNFSDNIFGFATATSGYRRGGINPATPQEPVTTYYDTDELWNYELGLKTTLMDGRIIANVSAYLIDYTDIQLTIQDPINFSRSTQNVGKAEVTGIEMNLAYQLNEYVKLSLNGSLSIPELKEVIPVPVGAPIEGNKGDRLPGSPTKNFTLAASWHKPLTDGFELFGSVSYKYVGQRWNDFESVAYVENLPSYNIVDFRVGVDAGNGYSVSLFAHNLTDEAAVYIIDKRGTMTEAVATNRPRTMGVNFTYNF